MRVHSIEAIPIEVPLGKNFGGSTYTVLTRCAVITRMRTDEGLVSEVYNGDNRELVVNEAHDLAAVLRSEEHTSELQSRLHLVCRLLLEKKKKNELHSGAGRTLAN